MPVEWVVDASVLGAVAFGESRSAAAEAFIAHATALIAPDLIHAEMASIGAKKVWRGEETADRAQSAIGEVLLVVSRFVPPTSLAPRAFQLAATHRFSAYDGVYLALAEERSTFVVTLDRRLITRAKAAGLSTWVRGLTESGDVEEPA